MKILWICNVWPEATSSAAGVRTAQLIQASIDAGYKVSACSPCQSNEFQEKLTKIGVSTERILPNDSKFDSYIQELSPDIVIFDRFMIEEQFSWRVRNALPNALRVLETSDLHSIRRTRQLIVETGESLNFLNEKLKNSDDAFREFASIYRSDLTLITSDFELELLVKEFQIPANQLFLSRLFYSVNPIIKKFSERSNFVAIGNFNHPPNADSFKVLKRDVWPKIKVAFKRREIKAPEIHIYGAYPSAEFLNLSNPADGFYVKGWIEDSKESLSNYKLNLAPLRFGAGVKGKVLDGWSVGTPCIGTSIAAEGMCGELPFGGAICDSWDEFAESTASLYCDESNWIKAQALGFDIINTHYQLAKNSEQFIGALNESLRIKDEVRSQNFIGSLLWHQSLRSTEYFSRWIEEKNKNK